MTNSSIPYSFVPGTKAKANEVNANFVALADAIEQNKTNNTNEISELKSIIENVKNIKADKSEIVTEKKVNEAATSLNDYKTKGTYIFLDKTPIDAPKGSTGILIVLGLESSQLKQIWINNGNNAEVIFRDYIDGTWNKWTYAAGGAVLKGNTGFYRFTNNMYLQWGVGTAANVTYPISYSTFASVVFSKNGFGASYERSDTGFVSQSLTGFSIGTGGLMSNINWIVIGY